MRGMLAGDTHGDLHHLKYLIELALEFGVEVIVVLGDFGYWEHQASGIYFLDYIENKIAHKDLKVYFIDGNHENHTLLRRRYMGIIDEATNGKTVEEQEKILIKKKGPWRPSQSSEGFWAVREGVFYIPRGTIWEWNGIKLAAMGGAYSIDINSRKPGSSWWPEEMIEFDEVDALRDKGPVDILLSHDVPTEIDIQKEFITRGRNFFKADHQTIRNRANLSKVAEHLHPKYIFHGHYHMAYRSQYTMYDGHVVEVVGVDMNGTGIRSFKIVDLKRKEIDDGTIF